MVDGITKTVTDTVDRVFEPIELSAERIAMEETYDAKLIECYTSEAESCSHIISEMIEVETELDMKETIASEEIRMEQDMQVPITQTQTITNQTQGVTYAQ